MGKSKPKPPKPPTSSLQNPESIKKYEDMFMEMDFSKNPYESVTNTLEGVSNPYGSSINPYKDLENPYTGQTNQFENLSNAYEGMGNVYSGVSNAFASVSNPWAGAQNKWAGMKAQFAGMENQFEDLDNQYVNLKNQYAGMENSFEELGVSTEAQEFAAQKQAQSRADIMSALSGAAGGSGISGLAQTLANQASQDARQSSVEIARQESDNDRMRAQEEARIETMERGEQSRLETLVAGEESRLDQLEASEAAKIDTMQRQELGDIDRQERAGAERLQSNKKNAALSINMAKAQAQQGINMAEASYAGQIDAMQRGETSRLETLKAGEASRLDDKSRDWTGRMDEQIAGRDIFTSDKKLDTDLQLDLAKRGADMELQKLYAEGDIYTQGLEMDRVTTLLSGALGVDASKRNARAQRSAGKSSMVGTVVGAKISGACIPKGTCIDTLELPVAIENIKPGDVIIGYDGIPVKVMQKHEYLEDPTVERFYEIIVKDGDVERKVNCCDMHRIFGTRAKDIEVSNIINTRVYGGVEFSYDLVTEDAGYRINGIPVNSMVEEMAELIVGLKKEKLTTN